MSWVYLLLGAAVVSAAVGAYVSHRRDLPMLEGAVFGLLLGPFGPILAALMPPFPEPLKQPVGILRGQDYAKADDWISSLSERNR